MVFLLVVPVAAPTQRPGIIVVVTEIGQVVQSVGVGVFGPLAVVISEVVHVLLVEEGVSHPEEERVVQHRVQGPQVASHVPHAPVEDLPHRVHPRGLGKLAPEPLRHFGNGVDSYPIDVVLADEISDPAEQGGADVVVLLLEVGQLGQPAVLNPVLVVVGEVLVRNLAPVVVVAGVVERRINSEIGVQIAHMVGHHVHHHQNIPLVASAHKVNEILLTAEVVVESIEVSAPIAMIPPVAVIDDRGDPNGVEAHTLDIVQIVNYTPISSSAVVPFMIQPLPRLSQP